MLEVLRLLSNHWINHVISFDIETDTRNYQFLCGERILGVGFAIRRSGNLTELLGIEKKSFVLSENSDKAEIRLLENVNKWLTNFRLLGVLGYRHRGYDVPLLITKREMYKDRFSKPTWKLLDLTIQTAHIDLYPILKTKYKLRPLATAIDSPEFEQLPLDKQKGLVSSDREQKGHDIYNLWTDNRKNFVRYMEGDALNVPLIAEHIVKSEAYDL